MRCNRCLVLLAFVAGVVLLREGIQLLDGHLAVRQEQARLILDHDLRPAAIFYTESPQALAAEKTLRRRLPD